MTIRFFTSFLLLFITNCSFAQTEVNDSVQNQEVYFRGYNKQKAISDIKNEMIFILLPGGLAPSSRLPDDAAFEKKYGIWFVSQGCIRYAGDNASAYNEEVFNYLDEKFGTEWQREIRKDAVGLYKRFK